MTDLIFRLRMAARVWKHDADRQPAVALITEAADQLETVTAERDQNLEDFAKNYAHMTAQLEAVTAQRNPRPWERSHD